MCVKEYLYGSLPPSTGHFFRCGPWILKVLPNFGSQDPQIPQEKCCKNTSHLKVKKKKSTSVHLASVKFAQFATVNDYTLENKHATQKLVVWVDVSPFPKVYFHVPTIRFHGVSVIAGDFFGGLTECQTIKQLNWSGQSPTLWISCRRTPWCPLESCGLVTGGISRKKVFWSWEVGCVVFSHKIFLGGMLEELFEFVAWWVGTSRYVFSTLEVSIFLSFSLRPRSTQYWQMSKL